MFYRAVMAISIITLSATAAAAQSDRSASANPTTESPREAWTLARSAVGDPDRWIFGSSSVTIEILNRSGEVDRTMMLEQSVMEEEDHLVLTVTPVSSRGRGFPMLPGAQGGEPSETDPDSPIGRMLSRNESGDGPGQPQVPANPFASAVAEDVTLSNADRSRSFGGVRAREYAIEWTDPDGSSFSGAIWLNANTGAPVRLDVTGDMAQDDIREFHTTISYGKVDGVTLPVRSITSAARRMNLFITVRTRITVSYSDYFETDGTRQIILGEIPGQED